jgi:predicted transcriptional regulator
MKSRGLLGMITFSKKRSDILLLLQEKSRTLSEIKNYLKITSPEILPQIRKMEKNNLIYQEDGKYALTEVGEILTKSFDQLSRIVKIFETDMEFWKEHEIAGIPEEFRLRLHELGNYKVVQSDPVDIFKPHKEFMQNLLKSKWIKGVSPIFHPDYPKFFLALAKSGADVALIVTRDVFKMIKSGHTKELEMGLKCKNTKMLICEEDVKTAFTVTDKFLSLGLFGKNGLYDVYHDLISYDASAVKFGKDLFSYYERRSNKVESQEF